jgi:hypothetical protein
MSAIRLIGAIEAAGCTIAVEGGEIVVRGARALPPELVAEIRQHRPDLVAALTAGLLVQAPLPRGKLGDDEVWVLDPQRACGSYVPHAERDGFGVCGKFVVLGAARCPEHHRNFLALQQRLRDAGLRTWPEDGPNGMAAP